MLLKRTSQSLRLQIAYRRRDGASLEKRRVRERVRELIPVAPLNLNLLSEGAQTQPNDRLIRCRVWLEPLSLKRRLQCASGSIGLLTLRRQLIGGCFVGSNIATSGHQEVTSSAVSQLIYAFGAAYRELLTYGCWFEREALLRSEPPRLRQF